MVPAIRSSAGGNLAKSFNNVEGKIPSLTNLEIFAATAVPYEPIASSDLQKLSLPSSESFHLGSPLDYNSPSLVTKQDHLNYDDFPATTETTQDPDDIPIYVIAIVLIVLFVMSSAFLYYLCRCLVRRKKRENQLASITPKVSDPRMAGVRANHPIEFVVPTTILMSENTAEDTVSENDYSSSGAKSLPIIVNKRMRRSFSGFHINPEDLQHGLYVGVKAASSEKGAFLGDLGKVGFSLSFNSMRNQLTVHLIGAKDLPCHFLKTTANPCAKVVLLPDRTTKYMTKVQKNTTSPVFSESFVFCIRRDDLEEKRLKISVWDYDRFSRKCLIGQVTYSVKDSGLTNSLAGDATTGDIWVDLKPDSSSHSNCAGEMLFSLCYNADASNLTLTVLKVRGLSMQQDKGKDLSVYAKVTLYVRRKLVRTKKTPTRRKIPEVEFNSSFDVHVPNSALGELDLLVTLCERGPGLGLRRVLGRTQVGANCICDQGLQHWQDMLLSPKSTCAQWHVLCGP